MSDIVQTNIKNLLTGLSEDFVDGMQTGTIDELISILERGDTFGSLLNQAMEDAVVDERGQFRSYGLESIIALACRESTRLSNHANAVSPTMNMSVSDKIEVATALTALKTSTNELMQNLARSRFWKKYPGVATPVLSAWLTDKGDAVGRPVHRNMDKEAPVFIEKCYIGVLEPDNSFDIPAGIFVMPQSDYRMDESVGEKVRQEFVVDIGSIVMGMLLGQHRSLLADNESAVMPRIPERKWRKVNSGTQDYLRQVFGEFAKTLNAASQTVKAMMDTGMITGYEGFELYERVEVREPPRHAITAEENPDAILEIGAFS